MRTTHYALALEIPVSPPSISGDCHVYYQYSTVGTYADRLLPFLWCNLFGAHRIIPMALFYRHWVPVLSLTGEAHLFAALHRSFPVMEIPLEPPWTRPYLLVLSH
jgi:hypothetical protein